MRGGIDDIAGSWKALKSKGPAIRYPFELDAFQKEAVLHLEQGHSVGFLRCGLSFRVLVRVYGLGLHPKPLNPR